MQTCSMTMIFTPNGSEVLMQMKKFESASKFTCIGELIKNREIESATAELLTKETGTIVPPQHLELLFHIRYFDVTRFDGIVYFYSAVLDKFLVNVDAYRAEPLAWLQPEMLDKEPELFAGNGLLQYALHHAMEKYGFKKKPSKELRYYPVSILY